MTFAEKLQKARQMRERTRSGDALQYEDLAKVGLLVPAGEVSARINWIHSALDARIAELEVLAGLDERIVATVARALRDEEAES